MHELTVERSISKLLTSMQGALMNYSHLPSLACLGILTTNLFAGQIGPIAVENEWRFTSSLSIGAIWSSPGDTQQFYLTPTIEKRYISQNKTRSMPYGELFAGMQKSFESNYMVQLGFSVAQTGDAKLQGIIWDDADPDFANHRYSYKIRHTHLAIKAKLSKDFGYFAMPYMAASVGVGSNKAHSYQNTPLIPQAVTNPDFADKSKNTFVYTIGAGVQMSINKNFQAGIGYQFADLGKSELGRAVGQSRSSGLHTSHFYTNAVLFDLTFVA